MSNNDADNTQPSINLAKVYMDAIPNISRALVDFGEIAKKITASVKPMLEAIETFNRAIRNIIPKDYFRGLVEAMQEAYNNVSAGRN